MKQSPAKDLAFAVYNPDWLDKDELIQQFVVRQSLFERIASDLRTATPETGAPHHLIVGQRGMGKTTFLRRLRYAIEDEPDLASRWIALAFPEEQYNVARLSNFWLNCLDALSDALERRGDRAASQRIDQRVDSLSSDDDDKLTRGALEALLNWCQEYGRSVVLLVDNIDLILDRLDSQQRWALRETLSHESRIAVVGSSVTPPIASTQYQEAFYDFFQVHELRGLTRDEARRLLKMLAERGNTPHVTKILENDTGRLATLHLLTGGNPRTLILLYQALASSEEGDVIQDVEHLLDHSTPLYKARVESLAPQAQQVFDQLALKWDPATAADLAIPLRMEVNKVSTQLDRLVRDGIVEKVPRPPGTKTGFQVSERFFNIWYLMRASRRVRRRLIWLVEFLKLLYGSQELAGRARRWLEKSPSDDSSDRSRHAELSLAFASAVEEPTLSRTLERHGLQVLMDMNRETRLKIEDMLELDGADAHLQPITSHLKTLEEIRNRIQSMKREWPNCTAEEFWNLLGGDISFAIDEKKRLATTLESLSNQTLIELVDVLRTQNRQWSLILGQECCQKLCESIRTGRMLDIVDIVGADEASLGSTDKSLSAISRAVVLTGGFSHPEFEQLEGLLPNCQSATAIVIWALAAQEHGAKPEDLAKAIEHAISLDSESAGTWVDLGYLFRCLDRYNESEAAYRKAIELDPKSSHPWNALGNLMQNNLRRYAESEAAYRKAIELDPKYAYPWNGLGNLMQDHLGRYEESEAAYRKAIELDPKSPKPWNGLGNLMQDHLGQYEEAEAAYRKAIDIDPKSSHPWNALGNLMQDHLGQYEEAEAAYRKAIELDPKLPHPWNGLGNLMQDYLDRFDEAEAAYRKAIELDPKSPQPWNGLGNLMQDHLGRYEESEAAYRKAIELDPKYAYPWNGLGNLMKNHLGRYAEAEAAYRKAIELDPKDAYHWNGLGNLLQDHLDRFDEAEAAYRKAIELDPKLPHPWNGLGNLIKHHLGRNAEAEAAYRKAIEIDPKSPEPWNGLGNLMKDHLGRYEEAEVAYRKAIELDPKDAYPWNGLGNLLKDHLRRHEEAEVAYRKAIELDPKDAYPWNELGNLLQDHLGRYEEAEAAYRKAIELDPKFSHPWNGLGNLMKNHLRRYEEAEAAYRKAVELDPKYACPWRGLGNLFQNQLCRFEEAEAAYRKAVELAPDDASGRNALAWHLFVANGDMREAESHARRALTIRPDGLYYVHTLSCIVLRQGNWSEGAQLARRFMLEGNEEFFKDIWNDIVRFFREAVATGHSNDAAQLLDETGFDERWRPLREALQALALGDKEYLLRLAPEVRVPAQELLPLLSPEKDEDTSATARSKRRSTTKTPRRNTRRRRQ